MSAGARLVAGRYRLGQNIGTGAMGVVWRAHDERLDRVVALKELLMRPGLAEADAETARARAMREGRIAARLQHPHAISVYDVALDRGSGAGGEIVPWLVMEYLPSRSLAAVLAEQGTLPPEDAARIGWQVASALAAAHQAGIVHRDIKPGNVLLGEGGIVKITDFGISRASWDATVTRTGVLAGTPAYFAPEVARGEAPGPASDVFSLGSMLYVAVEGEPPFGLDDNTLALLRTVAEGQVRPPQRAGPLSAILTQLLAADPAQRPPMAEVVAVLGAVATHGDAPVKAPRRGPERRGPEPWGTEPWGTEPWGTEPWGAERRDAAPPSHAAARRPPPTAVGLSPTPVAPRRRAARTRWWRRPAALFGAAASLVVLAVVLAMLGNVTMSGRDRLTAAQSAGPSPARPAPASAAPQQPAQLPQTQSQQQPPQPNQLEQTVRAYYGLLPEDAAVAWQYLGPAEHAQGFAHYTKFWNSINRISIRGPVAVQGNTVLVNLLFEPTNRKPTVEKYRLNMSTSPAGRVLIESTSRIAS